MSAAPHDSSFQDTRWTVFSVYSLSYLSIMNRSERPWALPFYPEGQISDKIRLKQAVLQTGVGLRLGRGTASPAEETVERDWG